jgi:hypothetical protein
VVCRTVNGVTAAPLSELETRLRDLAREMLGPDATPAEVRAFVVGQTAGLLRGRHPEKAPAQLRSNSVDPAGPYGGRAVRMPFDSGSWTGPRS